MAPHVASALRRKRLTFAGLLLAAVVYIALVISLQPGKDGPARSDCPQRSPPTSTRAPAPADGGVGGGRAERVSVSRPFLDYLLGALRNSPFPGAGNYTEYVLLRQPERSNNASGAVEPLRSDFGPVVNDVTSFRYPLELPPCRNGSGDDDDDVTDLFVIVISAPAYFDKRDVIRRTWLGQLGRWNGSVSLVGHGFIVGLTGDGGIQRRIEDESAAHGDILQVDLMDSYGDLSRKVAAALNWIGGRCPAADFVLKVDDDVYVNARNLISVVGGLNASQASMYGTSADGVARRDGKFGVGVDAWPWSNYPPYCMGAFLLVSRVAVRPLLAAAQTTPYFPFEDAFLGLCADKAKVKTRFSPRALAGFVSGKPQPCHVHNSVSWLTPSASVLDQSHAATEEFYANATRCHRMMEVPIDPKKTPRKFAFT